MNKSYKSFLKNDLDTFYNELRKEWNNQDIKFPNQTHTLEKWLVIIMEEIGEISKEVLEITNTLSFENIYKEIIQAITLLIRLRYSTYVIDLVNRKIMI